MHLFNLIALAAIAVTSNGHKYQAYREPLEVASSKLHQQQTVSQLTYDERQQWIADAKELSNLQLLQSAASNDSLCGHQLTFLIETLLDRSKTSADKHWALQMLDSWGKPGSGLTEVHLRWLGDYSECLKVKSPTLSAHMNTSSSVTQFKGRYCSVFYSLVPHSTGEVVSVPLEVDLGVCMPSGCSSADVLSIAQTVMGSINKELSSQLYATCSDPDTPLTTSAIVTIVFYAIFGVICLVATVYDYIWQNYLKTSNEERNVRNHWSAYTVIDSKEDDDSEDAYDDDVQLLRTGDSSQTSNEKQPGRLLDFLFCFSFYTNGPKLLSVQQASDSLTCIHGIRFISLSWVILGHSFVFSLMNMENFLEVTSWTKRFTFLVIANATVSVDTFFVLSGLLSSYLLLKTLQKTRKTFIGFLGSVPVLYLHRYIRLTPAYLFMVYFYNYVTPYLYDGPLKANSTQTDQMCEDYAWKNFLYINNIFDNTHQCAVWGWYLANDFQFFLVMPFIVYLLYRFPKVGLLVKALMILGSVVAGTVISAQYKLGLGIASLNANNQSETTGSQGEFMTKYYYVPWVRYQSYGIGILYGYLIWRYQRRLRFHWLINLLHWAIAAAVCLTIIYGTYDVNRQGHNATIAEAAAYNGFGRTAWSLAIGYVILACCINHGGFVNEFLSWPGFVPVSRLTYCAYLLHPVVMIVLTLSSHSLISWNEYTVVYYHSGFLLVSYAIAFLFSLMFEAPFMNIDRKYITGRLNRRDG